MTVQKMKKKDVVISPRNKKIGERLGECLKLKGMKQADLKRRCADMGIIISSAYFSQVINGLKPLNAERASLFAKILNVEVGYLVGDDDLFSESYDEYLSDVGVSSTLSTINTFLNGTDFLCSGVTVINNIVENYTINTENESVTIPADEIDKFLDFMRQTVSFHFGGLVERYSDHDIDLSVTDQELKKKYSNK